MRLPQDRILHIDTEFKDGKVNIAAEWQGELVRCKDCRHRYEEGDCTHYYWCRINDRPIDDTDFCAWGERKGEIKPEIVQCEDCIYAEETWTEHHEDYIECTQYNAIIRRGGYCLYGKRKGGGDE